MPCITSPPRGHTAVPAAHIFIIFLHHEHTVHHSYVLPFCLSIFIFIFLFIDSHFVFAQPFTEDFPRADIHEMLSPDIHQLIKGTFKDHLVTWVKEYLVAVHGETRVNKILDDIDRR